MCLEVVGNIALLAMTAVLLHHVTNSEFTLHALCRYNSTPPIDPLLSPQGASNQHWLALLSPCWLNHGLYTGLLTQAYENHLGLHLC